MKSIYFSAIAMGVSIVAPAQVTLSNPLKMMEFNRPVSKIKIPRLPAAKFIDESPFGKVYAMPPDNMPCLVPNFPVDNWMPVYNSGQFANPVMPNPIPRQQLPATQFFNNDLSNIKQAPKVISKNLMLDLIRKK